MTCQFWFKNLRAWLSHPAYTQFWGVSRAHVWHRTGNYKDALTAKPGLTAGCILKLLGKKLQGLDHRDPKEL